MLNAEHCVYVCCRRVAEAWVEFTYEIFRSITKKKVLQEMKFPNFRYSDEMKKLKNEHFSVCCMNFCVVLA